MDAPNRSRRTIVGGVGAAAAIALVGVAGVGEALSRPALGPVGAAPSDLGAHAVEIPTATGRAVAGWWIPGQPGMGSVLLLHGVRGNRLEMVARARFLKRLGYTLLLIDLPGHGESKADHITYGAGESVGVAAALTEIARRAPAARIGVIGVSLGAASLVLARPVAAPDAIVLESMFPTIDEAVADRIALHAGTWATPLAPLLLWQLPLRVGVRAAALRPIDALPAWHVPVLVAAGSADRNTTLAETMRLYAAANAPKELWIVDGAGHVDLHRYAPAAYEARISAFLARHLRGAAA